VELLGGIASVKSYRESINLNDVQEKGEGQGEVTTVMHDSASLDEQSLQTVKPKETPGFFEYVIEQINGKDTETVKNAGNDSQNTKNTKTP
jgi:hypothetical protein